MHIAPDRQPRHHPTTQFFTGRLPYLPPNEQRQSTEGKIHHDTDGTYITAYRNIWMASTNCTNDDYSKGSGTFCVYSEWS